MVNTLSPLTFPLSPSVPHTWLTLTSHPDFVLPSILRRRKDLASDFAALVHPLRPEQRH